MAGVQAPTRLFDSLILIFILIDLISPDCNLILSGEYNTKTLFSSLFGLLVILFIFSLKMKSLLCNFNSNKPNEVREHYIAFHKVDPKNEFFKKIFEEVRNVFHGKRCVRCQEFQEHSFIYDFYNYEALVDEFLLNLKSRSELFNADLIIRCRF